MEARNMSKSMSKKDYENYVVQLYLEKQYTINRFYGGVQPYSPYGKRDPQEEIKFIHPIIKNNPKKWHKELLTALGEDAQRQALLKNYQKDQFEKEKASIIIKLLALNQTKAALFQKVANIQTMNELEKFKKSLKLN